ncbi:hypothetical protein [Pelosinus sp. sgz500959]|uniref:hypothetical protein n=1 Tax=Pelosinus sp. sgz500959 TaxID=3242472 RepID=UPI0036704182
MTVAEYLRYRDAFIDLQEIGFDTQEKLEQLIDIVAKHKENLVEAIPHLEKLLVVRVLA